MRTGGRGNIIDVDELEKDLANIVRESRPPPLESRPPPLPIPISPGALSEDVKKLKSQAVTMGAATMIDEARKAADAYVADAAIMKDEVERWCALREREADEMAAHIARHHDSLIQAQKLFREAMNGSSPREEKKDLLQEMAAETK